MKKLLFILAFCLPFLFCLPSYASPSDSQAGNGESALEIFPYKDSPYCVYYMRGWYSSSTVSIFAFTVNSIDTTGNRFRWDSPTNNGYVFRVYDGSTNVSYSNASFNNYTFYDGGWHFTSTTSYPTYTGGTWSSYHIVIGGSYELDPPPSYDETVGLGGRFWLFQSGGLVNDLSWGAMWKYDDVRSFQLTIIGSKKTDKFDFTDNGGYWFNPFDYGVLGEQITLYLTPFDNNGNWGNTLTLSKGCYNDLADAIAQPFQGYVRKATNDVDIIGIDDTDIITIVEKPDTVPITNPTVVNSTTVFSPVYQTTNQQSVFTYVENNYYTSNDYSTTINNIDKHTEFNINIDFGNDSGSNLTRWETAKSYLHDGASTIGGAFDVFNGTLFAPIGSAIIIGLGVIIGLALVLVIVKLLGVIF